jgi:D-apionolactonase
MIALVKLRGNAKGFPVIHKVRCGNLSMIYEEGSLRYISLGKSEIIRMIYPAVRDSEWLNVQPRITGEKIIKTRKETRIVYKSCYCRNDIDFEATFTITVYKENRLVVEMNGIAQSTFLKNRIGFCVLHPIEPCAGKECLIIHADGTATLQRFPKAIPPHQPFRNIRSMQWKLNETDTALLKFEGDVFETEDQRNWTDASFKTYGTPLDLPYPAEIIRGTRLNQRIELSLDTLSAPVVAFSENTVFRITGEIQRALPDIGIGSSSRPQPISIREAAVIKQIKFSHLRGELHLFDSRFVQQYATLAHESDSTGLPLELCFLFGGNPKDAFGNFVSIYRNHPVCLKRIIILSQHDKATPDQLISMILPAFRKAFPGIPVGAGTNCNFAELNRAIPSSKDIDFITFAIHPQEHAGDERSLMENTAAQGYTVLSAKQFDPPRPVCVSPVTLQRRFNANTANYETTSDLPEMPSNTDVRQMSLFGAAWTVGSLKSLIESGAATITYYETTGERGIFMGDFGSRWPSQFQAKKGMLFPVLHLFRLLFQKTGYRYMNSMSNQPLLVDGFTIADEHNGMAFLANMTSRHQKVTLEGITNYSVLFNMHSGNFDRITRQVQTCNLDIIPTISAKPGQIDLRSYETVILQFRKD